MKALALVFLVGIGACTLQATQFPKDSLELQQLFNYWRASQLEGKEWWTLTKNLLDTLKAADKENPDRVSYLRILEVTVRMQNRDQVLADLAPHVTFEELVRLVALR